jgi:hypothetical protein
MSKQELLNTILFAGFETWGEIYKAVKKDDYNEIVFLLRKDTYYHIKHHFTNYLRLQKLNQF